MPTIVASRSSASRGVLAWIVDMEPSWPVFMAWSMSIASAPRTSPTRMRSGRMRSALRTSMRVVTSPLPKASGSRVSRRTTWASRSLSSAESSMVTTRSLSGTYWDRALSRVVLPAPVPPAISRLRRASTMPARSGSRALGKSPCFTRPSRSSPWWWNLRMEITTPSRASGGTMTFSREPSGRRASTMGRLSVIGRPTRAVIHSAVRISASGDGNVTPVRWSMPSCSTYTWVCPFTRMSETCPC